VLLLVLALTQLLFAALAAAKLLVAFYSLLFLPC
jgi:hypothetical protein